MVFYLLTTYWSADSKARQLLLKIKQLIWRAVASGGGFNPFRMDYKMDRWDTAWRFWFCRVLILEIRSRSADEMMGAVGHVSFQILVGELWVCVAETQQPCGDFCSQGKIRSPHETTHLVCA